MPIEWNLTHAKPNAVCYRTSESPILAKTGGRAIAKSETLDVLGTSIRSDLRWDDHVFNVSKEAAMCLGFLKRYTRPKMEYNSHLWASASKSALDFVDRIQSRALKLIGDDRVASSINSLEHRRNVSCIVLFYKYYF